MVKKQIDNEKLVKTLNDKINKLKENALKNENKSDVMYMCSLCF